jgi:hypothetical protein
LPHLGPSPRRASSPSLRDMTPAVGVPGGRLEGGRATCFENAAERILVDSGIMPVSPIAVGGRKGLRGRRKRDVRAMTAWLLAKRRKWGNPQLGAMDATGRHGWRA